MMLSQETLPKPLVLNSKQILFCPLSKWLNPDHWTSGRVVSLVSCLQKTKHELKKKIHMSRYMVLAPAHLWKSNSQAVIYLCIADSIQYASHWGELNFCLTDANWKPPDFKHSSLVNFRNFVNTLSGLIRGIRSN